jgi:glycerol kinase
VYNAIVWQCRRTAALCEKLKSDGLGAYVSETTGLLIDAYFSATKIKWIFDNVPGVYERALRGEIAFGTVDSWLIWKLTNGRVHVTDRTNASRTLLYNIEKLRWDDALLEALQIPKSVLPEVRGSCEVYGTTNLSGVEIPIAGIAGDQQAALFGQACFGKGDVKNTYGTGCFMLMNTGNERIRSEHGLLTTIAASADSSVNYALEGSIFTGGAVVQWLRDEMRFIDTARDSEYHAQKVADNGGVYMVPAFTGLGTPHWDMYARGAVFGLTRGTSRSHIIRAALESIAYQTKDVLAVMTADARVPMRELKADGGASENGFLLQFQSDIINAPVVRPVINETTALGVACLAGLAVGFWKNPDEVKEHWACDKRYLPAMDEARRAKLYAGWEKAVRRSLNWE